MVRNHQNFLIYLKQGSVILLVCSVTPISTSLLLSPTSYLLHTLCSGAKMNIPVLDCADVCGRDILCTF